MFWLLLGLDLFYLSRLMLLLFGFWFVFVEVIVCILFGLFSAAVSFSGFVILFVMIF